MDRDFCKHVKGCAEVKRVLKKIQTAKEENTKSSESQRKGVIDRRSHRDEYRAGRMQYNILHIMQ